MQLYYGDLLYNSQKLVKIQNARYSVVFCLLYMYVHTYMLLSTLHEIWIKGNIRDIFVEIFFRYN